MQRRYQMARVLMGISLLLLLVFVGLWLYRVYGEERRAIQGENGKIFAEIIRKVQDSLVNELYLSPDFTGDSLRIMIREQLPVPPPGGPPMRARMMLRSENADAGLSRKASDSTLRVMMFSRNQRDTLAIIRDKRISMPAWSPREMPGVLSGFMGIAAQRQGDTSFSSLTTLTALLLEETAQAYANPSYILRSAPDSIPIPPGDYSQMYLDIPTQTRFMVEIQQLNSLLLRRIWPEILFAILLVGVILGAFWQVSRTLQKQLVLDQLKNELFSNITHELKTPIATVSIALEAVQGMDTSGGGRVSQYLHIARSELDRLSSLVDRVLQLSWLEEAAPATREPTDLRVLLEQTLEALAPRISQTGATIHQALTTDPVVVMGDPVWLAAVWFNLLDNALKYTENAPVITVRIRTDDRWITCEVEDQGPGIPAAYQEKIFEKFFRVPADNIHTVKGHGLGLSQVAAIVHKYGGRLTLRSQPGAGSCFSIQWPRHHVTS
ncbi:MAG: HAMP domain-containing sensor histidine kinase [Bacteroidia bacterium]|nr:HAMP domain-containing sensor histidine kinase [Bacteroidia bacterium]